LKQFIINPVQDADNTPSFTEIETPTPEPHGHDLLVRIQAVSVNPVDTKVYANKSKQPGEHCLGWDAAGVVEAVGEKVTHYSVGDKVYYAGDVTRPGSNASHQLVDERIVGHWPENLSAEQAAALPLTSITAYEALFDRMKVNPEKEAGKTLLIIGAAGGVGSIAIQLAREIADLNVIATTSRDETIQWCREMGANSVVNHRNSLVDEFKHHDLPSPDYILCLNDADVYFDVMAELIAPQGCICAVVDTKQPHDLSKLKSKSAAFVWEFMFTRAMYQTNDMAAQGELLNEVSRLVEQGTIRTTLNARLGEMSTDTLKQAHELLLSGASIGKLCLKGI